MGAQHGEDKILLSLFPEGYKGTAVEVGAGDGVTLSNTDLLEHSGWRVICVEPDLRFADELAWNRKEVVMAAVYNSGMPASLHRYNLPGGANREKFSCIGPQDEVFIERFAATASPLDVVTVPTIRLDALLDERNIWHLDVLSVDVDGMELAVLESLGRHKPSCLLVEEVNQDDYETPVRKHLMSRGYWLAATIEFNDFWISDKFPKPTGYSTDRWLQDFIAERKAKDGHGVQSQD